MLYLQLLKKLLKKGGSPGLGSGYGMRLKSEGRGFESQHGILDGHLFVVTIVMLFEKTKINEKEPGEGQLFKKRND